MLDRKAHKRKQEPSSVTEHSGKLPSYDCTAQNDMTCAIVDISFAAREMQVACVNCSLRRVRKLLY